MKSEGLISQIKGNSSNFTHQSALLHVWNYSGSVKTFVVPEEAARNLLNQPQVMSLSG